ncbi:MAG: YCF48-related protein [Pirellulales bacterium]
MALTRILCADRRVWTFACFAIALTGFTSTVAQAQRARRDPLADNPFDLREPQALPDEPDNSPFDIAPPTTAQQPPSPELDDAGLNDVAFVDADHGWAVGDRGVIWHTDNAGATWHAQPSGTTARLTSVHFLDSEQGWAAGFEPWPRLGCTRGVLLHTVDGGRTWRLDRNTLLPSLRAVKFVTPTQGWAVAASSALYPGGVLWTEDGGQSWSAVASGTLASWTAGVWLDGQGGVVVGPLHGAATVDRRSRRRTAGLENANPADPVSLRDVALAKTGEAWMVGDGGQVVVSRDGGRSCEPACEQMRELLRHVDFSTVAVVDSQIWIAGAPGSFVLHSADGGRDWTLYGTGQSLPIRAIEFLDANRGWAVGSLGTILGTTDGGRSWQTLRAPGRQAAWLGMFASGDDVPFEICAQLAAGQGYRGVLHTLNNERRPTISHEGRATSVDTPADAEVLDRLAASAAIAGVGEVSAAWRFAFGMDGEHEDPAYALACWNASMGGRAFDELADWLAVQLRTWRPQLVLTYGREPRRDKLRGWLHAATLEAVSRAADPQALRNISGHLALAPWEVARVVGGSPDDERAGLRIASAEIPPRLARSLGDVSDQARALGGLRSPGPELWGFSIDKPAGGEFGRDLFSGLQIAPGSAARRSHTAADTRATGLLQRYGQQQRNARAIFERAINNTQGGELLAQLGELTRGWQPDAVARLLETLARQAAERGAWDRATELWQLLVEQYPHDPLAPATLIELLKHDTSSEIAWRMRYDRRQAAAVRVARAAAPLDPELGAQQPDEVALASAEASAPLGPSRALRWAPRLEQLDGALYSEPFVRFPLVVAARSQIDTSAADPRSADRYVATLRQTRPNDNWWACAAGEEWLVQPDARCPKPLALCPHSDVRPRLDAELDDPCWQLAEPHEIKTSHDETAQLSARWRMSYDNEFLYLAVECRRLAGIAAAPAADEQRGRLSLQPAAPRQHDDALHAADRVEISLDCDRDYMTAYRLTVDQLGRPADVCCGDATWNPTWYIAAGGSEGVWVVEAAIPWQELAPRAPQPGETWAVGVVRVVPGRARHAWAGSFTSTAPAIAGSAWGLLQFR